MSNGDVTVNDPPMNSDGDGGAAVISWGRLVLFGILYAAAVQGGLLFFSKSAGMATLWPAGGIALGFLLLTARRSYGRILAVVLVANALDNLINGYSFPTSIGFALANTAELALGAWVYSRLCTDPVRFWKPGNVLALLFIATVANACAALLGAAVPTIVFHTDYWHSFLTWFAADGLGIMLFTPLVLSLFDRGSARVRLTAGKKLEYATVLMLLAGSSFFIFGLDWNHYRVAEMHLDSMPYLLMIYLVWIALRFGVLESVLSIVSMSAIVVFCTVQGLGLHPLGGDTIAEEIFSAQIFLFVICFLWLYLAVSVNERRQILEEVKHSKAIFEAVTTRTPDHIQVQDKDFRYLLVVNPQLGLTQEEMIDKTDHDFLKEEEADRLTAAKRKVVETATPLKFETSLVNKMGLVEYFDGTYVPRFASDGRVDGVIGYLQNVTERKKLEGLARLQGEIARNISEGIYLVSVKDLRIVYANPKMEALFGYAPGEMIDEHVSIINAPSDVGPEQTAQDIERALRERGEWHGEVRNARKDGTLFWGHASISLMHHPEHGQVYVSLQSDITERKKAEEALRESERQFKTLVENTPDIIIRFDRDLRYIFVNKVYETITNLPREDILGKTLRETGRLPDTQIDWSEHIMRSVLETGKPVEFETSLPHPNGVLHLHSRGVPEFDEHGEVQSALFIHRDITERKRAEDAVRESQTRLQAYVEQSREGITLVDLEGRYVMVNPALCRMTGYSREELLGMNIRDLSPPASKLQLFRTVTEQGGSGRRESELLRKDGSRFTASISASIIQIEGHRFVQATVQDITERKQMEEALIASEERYRRITETITDYIYSVRIDCGRVVDTQHGSGCRSITGYDSNDFKRDPQLWMRMVHPEDRNKVAALMQEVSLGRSEEPIEHRIIHKNGGTRWIRNTPSVKRDEAGNLTGYDGLIQDITEHKEAELRLQESENKFSSLFNNATIGMFRTKFDGSEILDMNEKFHEIFGYTREEMKGQPSLMHWADSREREEMVSRLSAGGEVRDFECRMLNKQGAVRTCLTSLRLERDSGILEGSIIDITDRIEAEKQKAFLEDQLRQAQKMEAIGTLAGGVAHDFNNILTAIEGYSHLLLLHMKSGDPLLADVRAILEAAHRAGHLTKALLSFSRKQPMLPRQLDLNAVVRDIERLLERLIGEDIELIVRLDDDQLPVMADSAQIGQVIMNLATNSRDAMPNGGSLTISTESEEIIPELYRSRGFDAPGHFAVLRVADSGEGMSESTRARIFDPFFTTKEVGKGTGLGLAIVYGIMKQHKGHVEVISKHGHGTEFKIYIPLDMHSRPSDGEAVPAVDLYGEGTILLVEDNEGVRRITRKVLEEFGYRVIEAENGKSGLDAYRKHRGRISLVLSDVVMPQMNGRDLHDAIRSIDPNVRVLFMSGYTADVVTLKELYEAGTPILFKPVVPQKLLQAVKQTLSA